MPRTLKNEKIRRSMCDRLKTLVEIHLKMSIKDISKLLGYSNTTVLRRAWKGEVFPDTEKLATLAKIKNIDGSLPNIHWLITGQGPPLLPKQKGGNMTYIKLNNAIAALPVVKAKSLLSLLID